MKNLLYTIIAFAIIYLLACKGPDSPGGAGDDVFVFTSLTVDDDTIMVGDQTFVRAQASGYLLTYYWSTTAGNILGSGEKVSYVASPCQVGENEITCTIKDGNNQIKKKTVKIVVQ